MPTFIKTGYWEKLKRGYKGFLNLDDLIIETIPQVTLTAGANVIITGSYPNFTITSSATVGSGFTVVSF